MYFPRWTSIGKVPVAKDWYYIGGHLGNTGQQQDKPMFGEGFWKGFFIGALIFWFLK